MKGFYSLVTLLILPSFVLADVLDDIRSDGEIERSIREDRLNYMTGRISLDKFCQSVAKTTAIYKHTRAAGQAAYERCLDEERARQQKSKDLIKDYKEAPQEDQDQRIQRKSDSWLPWK